MKIRPFLALPAAGLFALAAGCAVETEPVPPADAEAPATTEAVALVNETCPLMGGDADPAVTTEWNGQTVGFCCAQCIPEWQELTEEEKAEKLAAAQAGETQNAMDGDA
ncbi:hypothetical protein [Alienimonas californiensis]|uniref:YHS domain protein n=1 Tax=Alienimonas californiensis TaxID=2527989 RepID=A0A517PBD5_9PLAN|nr:hypothetical protein [Alienimonas californiensis]QDT16689.1 hypothetical protein CA12_27950 [Alienimonas californiensis]